MSEEPTHATHGDAGGPVQTGVPAVDEVLRSLEPLAQRPVDEHVEVFERAHERLRRALDADPTDRGDDPGRDTGQAPDQAPGQAPGQGTGQAPGQGG